jgi:hypothetical protein
MDISSTEISFMVFRRATRDDLGEFSLDGQMLGVLMEFNGKKAVLEVAKNTGLSMGQMRQLISKLLNLKLIEPVEEAVSAVDSDFFDYLNGQLSLCIGPLAGIIIEDAVSDLGHTMLKFPVHRAAELVDLVSREIQKDGKRNIFKQNLLNKIKEKGY